MSEQRAKLYTKFGETSEECISVMYVLCSDVGIECAGYGNLELTDTNKLNEVINHTSIYPIYLNIYCNLDWE